MEVSGIHGWPVFCGDHDGSALSTFDRRDLRDCEAYALALGYQGLTIHAVNPRDGSAAAEVACTCKIGETWVSWVFARIEDLIVSWSALTGGNAGSFVSMSEAVRCVLLRDPGDQHKKSLLF